MGKEAGPILHAGSCTSAQASRILAGSPGGELLLCSRPTLRRPCVRVCMSHVPAMAPEAPCPCRRQQATVKEHHRIALQAQGREERSPRSPRRCVRLQESCLGHKLPCCDPCAACYCRFFNANCFCKKFTNTFSCGRN
uniref:Agouti domain-containing protein n=1 Tax=Varanus komodoensis TaxID=61221 RepID=A0A8D2LD36_VARKO